MPYHDTRPSLSADAVVLWVHLQMRLPASWLDKG